MKQKTGSNVIYYKHKIMRFLLSFLLFIIATSANAQFNIVAFGSSFHNFEDVGYGHIGAGIRGEYPIQEDIAIYGGFSYYHTAQYDRIGTATAFSPTTLPQTINYDIKNILRFDQFYAGGKKYIYGVHNTLKKAGIFGLYLSADLGILTGDFESESATDEFINYQLYEVPLREDIIGTFMDFTLNLGVGFEFKTGPVYLFIEPKGLIKIFQAKTTHNELEFNFPFTFVSSYGIRIPLSESY